MTDFFKLISTFYTFNQSLVLTIFITLLLILFFLDMKYFDQSSLKLLKVRTLSIITICLSLFLCLNLIKNHYGYTVGTCFYWDDPNLPEFKSIEEIQLYSNKLYDKKKLEIHKDIEIIREELSLNDKEVEIVLNNMIGKLAKEMNNWKNSKITNYTLFGVSDPFFLALENKGMDTVYLVSFEDKPKQLKTKLVKSLPYYGKPEFSYYTKISDCSNFKDIIDLYQSNREKFLQKYQVKSINL